MVSRALLRLVTVIAVVALASPLAMAQDEPTESPPPDTTTASTTDVITTTTEPTTVPTTTTTTTWTRHTTTTTTEEPTTTSDIPTDTVTDTSSVPTVTLTDVPTTPLPTNPPATTSLSDSTGNVGPTTLTSDLVPTATGAPNADDGGLSSRDKGIVGGVVGGVGGAILIGAVAFFVLRQRRLKREQADVEVFNPHLDDDDYRESWTPDRPDSPPPLPPPHISSRQ